MTQQEKSTNLPQMPSEHALETEPLAREAQALIGTGPEGTVKDQLQGYVRRVRGERGRRGAIENHVGHRPIVDDGRLEIAGDLHDLLSRG